MLMILMKLSFVPQSLFTKFFVQNQDHDQDFIMKFNNKMCFIY